MAKNLRFGIEIPTFDTDIEKAMHKIVSTIRYNEKIELSTEILTVLEEKAMIKALQKSAKWNCIELKIQKVREKSLIRINVNGL